MIKNNNSIIAYNAKSARSARKSKCTSSQTNNIFQYNLNNNKINNNYNIINIGIDKYNPGITPNKIEVKNASSNDIKSSKISEYILNTNPNNNEFLRNESKKLSYLNNSKTEDYSLLKSINNYKQTNNNPVKLYKREIKENKDKRIFKEREIDESINNINNLYNKKEINSYNKKENISNIYTNKNKIKKHNSVVSNHKNIINQNNSINAKTISNRDGKNKNNNIFYNSNNKNNNNINNSNSPNLNLLNMKKRSINISSEKKGKNNIIEIDKNSNYISIYEPKENNIQYKNYRTNLKNVADELLEKNQNLKNINKLKPGLGKTKINNNYLNPDNDPSFIKTNTIRFNENNLKNLISTDDNSKSYKNILYKSNNESINENNIKKHLILNNSEMHLFGNKILTSQNMNNNNNSIIINNSTEIINNDNINNYNDNNITRNSNTVYNNNRGFIKRLKINQEISNLNLFNYFKKINVPLTSTNNSIQLNNMKFRHKNLNPTGIYIKPNCAISQSKSKLNIKSKSKLKSKSEMKINNRNKKNNIVTSLNKNKMISKSLNSEISFNTSIFFYLKGEYIKNHMNSFNKLTASSHNSTNKNFSTYNYQDYDFSYENLNKEKNAILKQLNNCQIKTINNPFKKAQSFIYKICNYCIKQPKIEICHFIKNEKKSKKVNNDKLNASSEKSVKDKKLNINININNSKASSSLVKEIFVSGNNIYDEEKINENSQNGFLVTFGDANSNKKNIENNTNNTNNISRTNIENIIDKIAEDSDYEIYQSIQKSQNIHENNILNIYNFQFSMSDDNQDYDPFQKDINNNLTNELIKSTNNVYNKKMCKTFKNKSKSKYNLENAEKGLNILGKIAQRRGIKNNNHQHLNLKSEKDDKKYNQIINKKVKKLDEFNYEREINNNDKKSDSNNKRSRSVNKDIMKGISKIANILGRNKNDKKNKGNQINIEEENPKMNNGKIYPDAAKANNNLFLSNNNFNENVYFNKNIRYSKPLQSIKKFNKIDTNSNLINKYGNKLINPYNDRNLRLKDNSISASINY